MTNISTYPLIDDFETTLAQEWDGAIGTVYVNSVPAITFPASTTTHITVNPGKTTQQTAVINALDSSAKTLTVSSISVNKGASLAYTQQTHGVGSIVRISIPYAFIAALVAALNTKIDGLVQGVYFYVDEATRNAALGASPATDGLVTGLTTESKIQYSLAGSRLDWSTTSSTFNNASTTVAGKVEMATTAESKAGTDTGGTGALTVVAPSDIAANQQSGTFVYAGASAAGNDTYVVSLTPALTTYTTGMRISFLTDVANTGACTINVNSLGAKSIKTKSGSDPGDSQIGANQHVSLIYDGTNFVLQDNLATSSQATSGTATDVAMTAKQVKDNYGITLGSSPGPSDILLARADTERSESGTTYVKEKQITVAKAGAYYIEWQMKTSSGTSGYSRFYVNGSAVGTEKSLTNQTSYQSYNESYTATAGDSLQLYAKGDGVGAGFVNNFRVRFKPVYAAASVSVDID